MYPSFWQILIFLTIAIVLFGHKRVREFGKSLGEGLKDFKKGLEDNSPAEPKQKPENQQKPTEPAQKTENQQKPTEPAQKTENQ